MLMFNRFFKIFVFLLVMRVMVVEAANVAVIAPKEGPMAKYGLELISGVQTAVDMVNEEGGINGEKINLIAIDDRCEDTFAVSAAQMMSLNSSANDKINMVIGPYCNNMFYDIADIYSKGKIIRFVPMPLNAKQHNFYARGMIKLMGRFSDEAETFFDFYKNKMITNKLAMVYDSTMPETTDTAFELQQLFRENNISNLTLFNLADYNKNFSQMAQEILLNNQIVYILGDYEKTARLVQRLQEEKEDVVVFVDEYLATEHLFNELGNFAEGIYVITLKDLKNNPEFTEELVTLRLKGKEPKGLGVYGYVMFRLWEDMAKQAKSVEFDKIINIQKKKTFNLPWGNIDWQRNIVEINNGYNIYQIKNGEYMQVN